ncbi:hypothetical protein Golob_009919, partial [Gossypium lobatum]|nr:hypothetical protein [Gossypium lobatum]
MIIGLTNILQVEVGVVIEGLKLAWDRGFRQIELECDSAMLIEFIQNGWASMSNDGKIRGIRGLCLIHLEVKFRHIQGEVNRVADCIAKADAGMIDQLVILEEPPRY